MTTLASTGKRIRHRGGKSRNSGARKAPIRLRCAVAAASISSWSGPVAGIDVGEVRTLPVPASAGDASTSGEPLRKMEEIVIGGYFETEVVPAGPPVGRDFPVFPDRPAGGGRERRIRGPKSKPSRRLPGLVVVERMFPDALPRWPRHSPHTPSPPRASAASINRSGARGSIRTPAASGQKRRYRVSAPARSAFHVLPETGPSTVIVSQRDGKRPGSPEWSRTTFRIRGFRRSSSRNSSKRGSWLRGRTAVIIRLRSVKNSRERSLWMES